MAKTITNIVSILKTDSHVTKVLVFGQHKDFASALCEFVLVDVPFSPQGCEAKAASPWCNFDFFRLLWEVAVGSIMKSECNHLSNHFHNRDYSNFPWVYKETNNCICFCEGNSNNALLPIVVRRNGCKYVWEIQSSHWIYDVTFLCCPLTSTVTF